MHKPSQYDLALSFWKVSLQYLVLVQNVAREIVSQGNTWTMLKDLKDGEITEKEYAEGTRWSDHTLIIPLLFNLYHGIEVLVKGFLLVLPDQSVKPQHSIESLCRRFSQAYPNETELSNFFNKFTEERCLPVLLSNFLRENNLTLKDLYQAVRYPSDKGFRDLRQYVELEYQGEDGIPFLNELVRDIETVRIAAVRLGRSLEVQIRYDHQQNESSPSVGGTEA